MILMMLVEVRMMDALVSPESYSEASADHCAAHNGGYDDDYDDGDDRKDPRLYCPRGL